MCGTITLGITTVVLCAGIYFTVFAPTCLYQVKNSSGTKYEACPNTIYIAGIPFETQNLCMSTPCIYTGSISDTSYQVFCHFSNNAIDTLSIVAACFFLIATIFGIMS